MSTELVAADARQELKQALVPRSIDQAYMLAQTMANSGLVPEHLQKKPDDCMLIVMQAQRWGMDAIAVAQATSVVRKKLCFEGKLVAAMLYSTGAIDGRFSYKFTGQFGTDERGIEVTAKARGSSEPEVVIGTVKGWKTDNENWKKNPDDMLIYRGTRQWARRYAPDSMLGVYTPDEMEDSPEPVTVTQATGEAGGLMPRAKPAADPAPARADVQTSKADKPPADDIADAEFSEASTSKGTATPAAAPAAKAAEPAAAQGAGHLPPAFGEKAFHSLSESQERIVLVRAKSAGLPNAQAIFDWLGGGIGAANLNEVLSALRALGEART